MNTPPPQSIPAADFKPRFDTSTTTGKIAVMQEAEKVGYVYMKVSTHWECMHNPDFSAYIVFYNFPIEPKRVLVPWTKDTVPREAWVREKAALVEKRIIALSSGSVRILTLEYGKDDGWIQHSKLLSSYEHSLDGGKTWLPCGTWMEEV